MVVYYITIMKPTKTKDIKILYFDTETVTLESPAKSCTFFQLGGIIEINGVEVERFNFFMNPDHTCEYDPSCLVFNGITEDDLEQYPSHEEMHAKLVEIFDRHVNKFDKTDKMHCVGYNNLKFDQDKLFNWFDLMDEINESKYMTLGSYCWTSPALDAFPYLGLIFIKYRNLFKNFKLETVARKLAQMNLIDKRFDEDDNWHDAMFDIEATRELFHFALRMFQMNIFDVIEEKSE